MSAPKHTLPVLSLVVGACLLPLGATLFPHVFWPGKGKPVQDGDLRPELLELASKANAFFILESGAKRMQWPRENRPQIDGMAESNPRWAWDPNLATDLLARNQGFLEVLDKALAVGKLQVLAPPTNDGYDKYLSRWSEFAMLASIQSAVHFREGREPEALELACKLIDLGHLYENSGGAEWHYRAGWTAKKSGLARLRQMVARTTLPVGRWKAVLKRLETEGADEKSLTNVFKVLYQVRVRVVDDLGVGKFPGTNETSGLIRFLGRTVGLPALNVGSTKDLFAQSTRVGLKGIHRHFSELSSSELPDFSSPATVRTVLRGNAFGEFWYTAFEPPTGRILSAKCRENATMTGTRLVIALHCYHSEHGALPDSLEALVPEYFDHVPLDDFDGKPFRYSRAKRIVYSVESDLVDAGGRGFERGRETSDLVFELGF